MPATLNFPPVLVGSFAPVHIGGGGYVTGMDVAADGTMVARVDVYGCYVCNGMSPWVQVVTANNMPPSIVGLSGAHTMLNEGGLGGYEIRIAATNTSVFYMFVGGAVLLTTDRGAHWTNMTNWASMGVDYQGDANGQASRLYQKKMAIDPINPNIVFIGTPVNGLYKTLNGLNGASATFSAVTGVPNTGGSDRTRAPGVRGVVFDPSHFSGSVTQYIYAATDAGVYASIDAGVSWTLLSGSPTNVVDAVVSQGVLYVAATPGLWKYTGGLSGTWTQIRSHPGGFAGLAVSPFNPDWMVVLPPGGAYIDQTDSLTTTNTWYGFYFLEGAVANTPPSDVGWLADTRPKDATGNYPSSNNWSAVTIWFDPVVSTSSTARIWMGWGYGVSYYDMPSASLAPQNTQLAFPSHVAGMELMVSRTCVSQAGYVPVISFMDEQVFRITDPTVYPPGSGLPTPAYGLGPRARNSSAWGMDASLSVPGVIGVLSTGFYVGITGGEYSSYSTNGGVSWTLFPVPPTSCNFTGSVSGSTLTVTAVASGTLGYNMFFQTANDLAGNYYINAPQLTGTPGGIGTYPVIAPPVLTTPVNAAFTATTGTLTAGTYYYRVSATFGGAETLASVQTSLTVGAGSGVVVNWSNVSGASGYKVYGRSNGAELLIATITLGYVTTYTDTGSVTPSGALPASNTTGSWNIPSGPLTCCIDGGQITCKDATHYMAVSAALACKPVYTTNAGATWLPCTGLPVDTYVAGGGKYNGTQMLTNDAGGNLYCYLGNPGSAGIGTYRSTDGGANWTRVSTQNITAMEFFLCTLKAVPGIAGNLFFSLGSGPNGASFYTTTYSGTGTLTWTTVANVQDVWCFGFGAPAGGGFTAPTLWLMGWVNKGGTGYKFGVWKSRDLGVSDWTWYVTYPAGYGDTPSFIVGDGNDPTKCYIGYGGTSAVYGQGLI